MKKTDNQEAEAQALADEQAYLTFESILKGLGAYDNALVLETLKIECSFDVKHPKRTYPHETFQQFIAVLHRDYFPNLTFEDACRKIGKVAYAGYRKTIIGRVSTAALHLFSPERAINEIFKTMKRDLPHQKHNLVKHAANNYTIEFRNGQGLPYLSLGLLEGVVATFRVSEPQVTLEIFTPEAYNIHISWK
jgi:uncharacterized protein (TIGR02265 family)